MPNSSEVGAVVIGGDYQGLAIVRSLGRRGIPVCVVDDERSISRFSRYTTNVMRVSDLRSDEGTVAALLAASRRFGLRNWVLFPTRDETVAAISLHREVLSETFRVPTPDWSVIEWAWDKRKTYKLAHALGIPTPRTWFGDELARGGAIDSEPPFAIKPAIKPRFLEATKAKAWRADSHAELHMLLERAAEIVDPAELLVQEVVPGNGEHQFAYCGFVKEGQSIGTMLARRERQHPPQFGRSSTYVATIDDPVLESRSARYLKEIGYYGLVELEYKQDPRDQELKLLDFNARTWGYHSLGARAGVDFPYLLFQDQLGLQTTRCRATPGVSWMRLVTDLPTAVVEIAARHLSVRHWLRTLRHLDTEAVFSREDPLPMLAEIALIPYLMVKRGY